MALPKSTRTPRLEELEAKLHSAPTAMKDWPQPTKEDVLLIGGIVVLYSYVEFNLRRLVETFDHAGLLPEKWRGKALNLDLAEVEKAVQETPVWAGAHDVAALKELEQLRPLRNLVAHFAVSRFPEDDAWVFVTKNRRDYKYAVGKDVPPGVAMVAIVERDQIKTALRRIQHIHDWLAQVTPVFEKRLGPPDKGAV